MVSIGLLIDLAGSKIKSVNVFSSEISLKNIFTLYFLEKI